MESGTEVAARWLPAPPDMGDEPLVIVTEALLPIFDWMNVAVVRAVQEKLSAVERFLIEAALALGDLDAEDIEELTGLPEEATRRIAGHLCEIAVLNAGAGRYTANEDAARATLAQAMIVELRPDVLTFLVLPRSADALAFEHKQGRGAPPQVHRLDPVANAPVPGAFRDATQAAVLRTLLGAGRVGGLPEDVTGIAEPPDDKPVPDVCPAYRYTGRLRMGSGQVTAKGHLYGERGDGTGGARPVPGRPAGRLLAGPGRAALPGGSVPGRLRRGRLLGRRRQGTARGRVTLGLPGQRPGGAGHGRAGGTAMPSGRPGACQRRRHHQDRGHGQLRGGRSPARRSSSPSMPPRTSSRTSRRNRCGPRISAGPSRPHARPTRWKPARRWVTWYGHACGHAAITTRSTS